MNKDNILDFDGKVRAIRELVAPNLDFDVVENALKGEAEVSVRLNPLKVSVRLKLDRVPWCGTGYYLRERPGFTFDPWLHAGGYYVQEASSMFLEQVIRQHVLSSTETSATPSVIPPRAGNATPTAAEGSGTPSEAGGETLSEAGSGIPSGYRRIRALDLCAAPGGKATLLCGALPKGSLVVCNEVVGKRAAVLAENMTKWGCGDVVVTNSEARAFSGLKGVFDLVVADVPCSGEGMFRKDEGAVAEWSAENVEMCRIRQRDIIADVWDALKPGGVLIYSTCTFNRYENEDNVAWIARELGADVLKVAVEEAWGIKGEYHFFPGYTRGEGFFCAALRKHTDGSDTGVTDGSGNTVRAGTNAEDDSVGELVAMKEGKEIFAMREEHRGVARKLRLCTKVLQTGVRLGEETKKGFIPAHAVALCAERIAGVDYPRVELPYEEAVAYLRGEALRLSPDVPKGYVIVTFRGLALGFVKNIGSRANNMYPDGWRIRSSYTRPFSIADLHT